MNLSNALAVRDVAFVIRGRPGPNDRAPLPAGHPETWGAITCGTILDGAEYPIPPFLDRRDDAAWRAMLALLSAETRWTHRI